MVWKKCLTAFVIVCLTSFNLCAAQAPKKVIIDSDVNVDDMMAILYLLKSPEIKVVAITTSGVGMAHSDYAAKNVLDLLKLAGAPDIPVANGATTSLSPQTNFPEKWRKSADRVFDIPLPKNPNSPSPLLAWQLITEIAQNAKEQITILTLGPLTNIAIALEKSPEIESKIDEIIISGGAVNTHGNLAENPKGYENRCAEYNIFLDVKAANDVFKSRVPKRLVPLETTEEVPVTHKFYKKLADAKRTPSANFVYEVIRPYILAQKKRSAYFWGSAAAAILTNPEIGKYKIMHFMIDDTIGPKYGCLFQKETGAHTTVCTEIDAEKFYQLFYETINDKQP